MSKTFSGKEAVKILCRKFGFFLVSQKGSHVKLRKKVGGAIITTIVPMHPQLALGTLRGVLKLARIDFEDFYLKK